MSVHAMNWVISNPLIVDRTQFCVMVALADRSDPDGICFPSQGRLARESRCSRATLQRTLEELKAQRLITTHRRPGYQTLEYRLNLDARIAPPMIPDHLDRPHHEAPHYPQPASSDEARTAGDLPHHEAGGASPDEAKGASPDEAQTITNHHEPSHVGHWVADPDERRAIADRFRRTFLASAIADDISEEREVR